MDCKSVSSSLFDSDILWVDLSCIPRVEEEVDYLSLLLQDEGKRMQQESEDFARSTKRQRFGDEEYPCFMDAQQTWSQPDVPCYMEQFYDVTGAASCASDLQLSSENQTPRSDITLSTAGDFFSTTVSELAEQSPSVENDDNRGSVQRANSWTHFEKSCLIGILFNLFLRHGTLTFTEEKDQSKFQSLAGSSAKSDSVPTWKFIYELFEIAREKALKRDIIAFKYPRTASGLHRRFKTLKMSNKRGKDDLRELFFAWREMYNVSETFLTRSDYGFPMQSVPELDEEKLQAAEGLCDHRRFHSSTKWTDTEEIILMGAVMERAFSFGSLVSGNASCWSEIKQLVDSFWEAYTKEVKKTRGKVRNATALKRHFRIMKKRQTGRVSDKNKAKMLSLFNTWCSKHQEICSVNPE